MLSEYLAAALRTAKYEILPHDKTYYGEIPGFEGVYANAQTLEACRTGLKGVLEDWILFRVYRQQPLPVIEGVKLTFGASI